MRWKKHNVCYLTAVISSRGNGKTITKIVFHVQVGGKSELGISEIWGRKERLRVINVI